MRKLVSTSALMLLIGAVPGLAQTSSQPDEQQKRPAQTQNQNQNPNAAPSGNQSQSQRPESQNGQPGSRAQQPPANQNTQSQQPSGQKTQTGEQQDMKQQDRRQTGQRDRDEKTNRASDQDRSQDRQDRASQRDRDQKTGDRASDQNRQSQDRARDRDRDRDRGQADRGSRDNRASVNLSDQQRTRISETISRQRVASVTNVNFSVSVGTVVPRSVRLHPLPSSVVAIVPQYRGYSFIVVRDEIVIIEPRSYRIVAVLPHGGARATTTSTTTTNTRAAFTADQRERIRTYAQPRQVVRSEIIVGQQIPADVELYEFPETLYTEIPVTREYRYITGPRGVVVVEPRGRRVIEVIE